MPALVAVGPSIGEARLHGGMNTQNVLTKEQVEAELERDMGLQEGELNTEYPAAVSGFSAKAQADSDGEEMRFCQFCSLPLGDIIYSCMHGECMALQKLRDMRNEEKKRLKRRRQSKDRRYQEYGIGWNRQSIPSSEGPASKLALHEVPRGMVCLVMDDLTSSIRLASTSQPAAAVNLEYLSTALQIKRQEGHEPIFSLDPLVNASGNHSMQEKVFVPDWLAGTSAGEVLFQADYHLKELSMGEYDQPIVGMKSCIDHSEMENDYSDWSARQWFVVRKAEIQICDGEVLLPYVKMGVEAREQVFEGGHFQDKSITRTAHPMVKYAETFSWNFDLIAERKSVVYHLRELAKTSVLAKYLLEAPVHLDETWFQLASQAKPVCCLEVPQFWNERRSSVVEIIDGAIQAGKAGSKSVHAIYGGVQFGLEKFRLTASLADSHTGRSVSLSAASTARVPATPPVPRASPFVTRGVAAVLSNYTKCEGPPGMSGQRSLSEAQPMASLRNAKGGQYASASLGAALPAVATVAADTTQTEVPPPQNPAPVARAPAVPMTPIAAGKAPPLHGVDLRLDTFDLLSAKRASSEAQLGSWAGCAKSVAGHNAHGDAFWTSLESDSSTFEEADRALLRSIFNPCLSDRRVEGDLFIAPDARHAHVSKLHALVKQEEGVRQHRKEEFCSKSFLMIDPSPLFPSSWAANVQIVDGQRSMHTPEGRPVTALVERKEYKFHCELMLTNILRTASPVFDKRTEDGMRFRMYRLGNLEVRTTQELNCEEQIDAVFSLRDPKHADERDDKGEAAKPQELIVKATEYVERVYLPDASPGSPRFFIVFETEKGHKILAESSESGDSVNVYQDDGENLQARISLARTLRSKECTIPASVQSLHGHVRSMGEHNFASPSLRKKWAHVLYASVAGESVMTKKKVDPIVVTRRREEKAKRALQNQAMAEKSIAIIPLIARSAKPFIPAKIPNHAAGAHQKDQHQNKEISAQCS